MNSLLRLLPPPAVISVRIFWSTTTMIPLSTQSTTVVPILDVPIQEIKIMLTSANLKLRHYHTKIIMIKSGHLNVSIFFMLHVTSTLFVSKYIFDCI